MTSAASAIADGAGNNSASTTLTPGVTIDNTKPACTISQSPAATTWTNGNVTLTVAVTETNKDKYSWT